MPALPRYTKGMLRVHRSIPAHSLSLLVFDLDGTLIDSSKDLCNSVNATLENFGLRSLPDTLIASFIGDGAGMLIRRALAVPGELPPEIDPNDEDFFQQAFDYFLAWYRAHKLDYTRVYPGVLESLDALRLLPDGSPRRMAVLTNKPVGPARAICDGLGLAQYFFAIYGGDSFDTKKPYPQGLQRLITEAAATPETTVMIGDSDVDVNTARNAGAWSLGCGFGLSPDSLAAAGSDILVDHASEWIEALRPW
uniref:HAD-superfamily hydrolase subfamily IA, variant 3 n=1 Tax=mine drainage metagenome TaxID=410659 RepID=E6PZ30_9ZZZZ